MNKTAVILGLGPSLQSINKDIFNRKDITFFGVNRWDRCVPNIIPVGFEPEYWCFWDVTCYRQALIEYFTKVEYQGTVIHWGNMWPKNSAHHYEHPNIMLAGLPDVIPFKQIGIHSTPEAEKIIKDLGTTFACWSSSITAYAYALYMGFDNILIAGQDYMTSTQHKTYHAYPSNTDKHLLEHNPWVQLWDKVEIQYQTLKKAAERKGIKTYNITPDKTNVFYGIFEALEFK